MAGQNDDVLIRECVKTIQSLLRDRRWTPANAVGELIDPTKRIWFTAVYTHGEYTVETSYRPTGAGVAEGVIRVRITPQLVQAHPSLARELAQDLANFAEEVELGDRKDFGSWPPEMWKTLTR